MVASAHKAILVSDFTLGSFSGYLNNDPGVPSIHSTIAPFGQVLKVMSDARLDCWQTAPELGIVWTRPEAVIEGFSRALQFEAVALAEILEQVDAYCEALRSLQERLRWVFVPTWILSAHHRGMGAFDLNANGGLAYSLMQMNLRLAQNLREMPNYVVLDAQKWVARVGHRAFNPKLWYLGKIPFTNRIFQEAVRDVKAGVRALNGMSRKLIILDLDDTLWSGVVGDLGWQDLVLGGRHPVGEALVDFQKELKALKNRGMKLAVVSKNEEAIALEAIRKHPGMVLKEEDLSGWRINWKDKAENVMELLTELHLRPDSAVFIDGSVADRARVREALPDVLVPEWPKDKLLYRQTLLTLDCFDTGSNAEDDRGLPGRTTTECSLTPLVTAEGSLGTWLESLNTRMTVEPLNLENVGRVVQLLNRTNQMNLSTRRMTAAELVRWASSRGCRLVAFRVADRFGDSGLTAILSTEVKQDLLQIVDFVLTGRMMGRDIEDMMLAFALEYGREQRLKKAALAYIPTTKNKPCFDFLQRSKLSQDPNNVFSWHLSNPYPMPQHIRMHPGRLSSTR